MGDRKVGVLILDAIDQLRKRKARPDLDRICHLLERRHGLRGSAVNEELARLVTEGVVIKVDYKGNTSYRNAAKWIKTKTQFYGSFYNSADISHVVLEAVRSLTMPAKDQPLRSATMQEIEQYLLKRDSQSNLNLATLKAVLEKEVDKHNLHQLPNGEYIPLKSSFEYAFLDKSIDGSKNTPLKRHKSDSDSLCHENSSNSSDESQLSRCDYCLFTATANRKGEAEELLTCKDCGAKAHPSCMEYTKLLYESYPQPDNWQCPDCKTCSICDETGGSNDLLTCYICFNGYHLNCHDPVITSKPISTWLCCTCDTAVDKEIIPKMKQKVIPVVDLNVDSLISNPFKDGFHKSLEDYPATIPVAKKWTISNVVNFFKFIGFEEEAPAFREQEIDGLSLLLMKRSDVLTGLGIKLGPALKIYKHVIKLQTRAGDN